MAIQVDLSLGEPVANEKAFRNREYLYEHGNRGLPPRARVLQRYEDFHTCREYAHQMNDWSGYPADQLESISPEVIAQEGWHKMAAAEIDNVRLKRPTAPLRLARTVTDRFTGLLFSRNRKPEISIEGDEQSEDFLREVFKAAKFWVTMHKARTFGGSMGSALVTVHLDDGRFQFCAHNPKTIQEIVFADAAHTIVDAILIQYIFDVSIDELDPKTNRPTGSSTQEQYLFRRIVDAEWDMTFKPQRLQAGKLPEDVEPDPDRSIRHNLGFCPGVWIQNLPSLDDGLDGVPDNEGAYQMYEAIDRMNAQANRGLLANMDPTLVISPDPKMAQRGEAVRKGSDHAINVGPNGDAKYLEIAAEGIKAGREFAKELKQESLDSVECIMPDPEKISGVAQSAKAIEILYAPTLEKADLLREQYGTGIEQLGGMVLRIARVNMDPARYPGRAQPIFRLPLRVVEKDADPDNPDVEPEKTYEKRYPGEEETGIVVVTWGAYFSPTPQDFQTIVFTIANAYAAGLIDDEIAAKKIAPLFEIKDWKQLLRKIQEQKKEKEQKAQTMAGLYDDGSGNGLGLGGVIKKRPPRMPSPQQELAGGQQQGGRP